MKCATCPAELGATVYRVGRLSGLCLSCAERVEKCPHEHGNQTTLYDADGWGERVWMCSACGWYETDPY